MARDGFCQWVVHVVRRAASRARFLHAVADRQTDLVDSAITVRFLTEFIDPVLRQLLRDVLTGAQRRGGALHH
eukprot:8783947-Lingulodinium_polyedra.AAC.1